MTKNGIHVSRGFARTSVVMLLAGGAIAFASMVCSEWRWPYSLEFTAFVTVTTFFVASASFFVEPSTIAQVAGAYAATFSDTTSPIFPIAPIIQAVVTRADVEYIRKIEGETKFAKDLSALDLDAAEFEKEIAATDPQIRYTLAREAYTRSSSRCSAMAARRSMALALLDFERMVVLREIRREIANLPEPSNESQRLRLRLFLISKLERIELLS